MGLLSAVVAGWTGLLFGAALPVPLAVRRRWRVAVFGWTFAVSLLQLVVISRPLPADVVPPFVLYTVAAHVGHRWIRTAAVAAGLLACVLGPWRWYASDGDTRSAAWLGVALAVFLGVLWLLGHLVCARDGTMIRLREANEALARDHDQRDQMVAQRERLAVARDVHDVVAHSLSVVVVQADGASYAAEHSSAKTTPGPATMARAMATRWAWPPDSSPGRRRSKPRSPRTGNSWAASTTAAALGRPAANISGTATFSTAGSSGSRWPAWNTNPKSRRRSTERSRSDIRARSRPRHVTEPVVAVRIPARTWRRVVFRVSPAAVGKTYDPGSTTWVARRPNGPGGRTAGDTEVMSRTGAALGTAAFLLAAPGVMGVLVPWLLTGWQAGDTVVVLQWVGWALVILGTVALLSAFTRFVTEGRGTPAPIAPTERLVVGGLNRYVRNPMYLAVAAVILGQGLLLARPVLLVYTAVFLLVTAAFVRWYEEPTLAAQYGAEYDAYRSAVRGWIPRLRPWSPTPTDPSSSSQAA